jgi:hypothetical protein
MVKFIYYVLFILLVPISVLADNFTIESQPTQIVKDESFQIVFKVNTKSEVPPEITFDPVSIQILSHDGIMTSTSATFINNKLTTKRMYISKYTAVASRSGKAYIRNIKVNLGGNVLTKRNHHFNISYKRATPTDVILLALPDKESVYKNESIFVNYYILYRGSIIQYENRKFPKLKGFTKRSYPSKRVEDRYVYNGVTYKRRPIFTAQLFPLKSGTAVIDPMTIHLRYRKSRAEQMIGGFGFGIGRSASKTITSKKVLIEVKQLPAGTPDNFSGLVGSLNFKLDINKNKFLVNEPIEIKLIGSGNVAFETYDAPSIYTSKFVEEFEKNADLKLTNTEQATETTNYTYLPRTTGPIPAKDFPISYLDPQTQSYKVFNLKIPELIIGGGVTSTRGKINTTLDPNQDSQEVSQMIANRSFIAPIFTFKDSFGQIYICANRVFLLLILLGFLLNFKNVDLFAWKYKTKYDKEIRDIKRKGIDYKGIHSILYDLDKTQISSIDKLNKSKLSTETKTYFKKIISSLELGDYYENKKLKIPFNKKYFIDLKNYLNETYKES